MDKKRKKISESIIKELNSENTELKFYRIVLLILYEAPDELFLGNKDELISFISLKLRKKFLLLK